MQTLIRQIGGFLRDAAEVGIALIFPDTSPRGAGVQGEPPFQLGAVTEG